MSTENTPSSTNDCPYHQSSSSNKYQAQNEKQCPMQQKVYNVYGEEIDPRNAMPPPQQEPMPGQKKPLSVERVKSTIPKGGTETTWEYPSQQMFFNALRRKGKAQGIIEDDMETVIAIHNNTNERTWKSIMEWESRFHSE